MFVLVLSLEKAWLGYNNTIDIYNRYLNIDTFESDIELEGKVCEALYKKADEVTTGDCDLEYKLLLAIAIRHKAERFMFNILENRFLHTTLFLLFHYFSILLFIKLYKHDMTNPQFISFFSLPL